MLVMQAIRPDAITRTGVIQPFSVRGRDPVRQARQAVRRFVCAVRPEGPQVVDVPTPRQGAVAAAKAAEAFRQGHAATVKAGAARVTVTPDTPSSPTVTGMVADAARSLARGEPVLIRIGYQAVVAKPNGRR